MLRELTLPSPRERSMGGPTISHRPPEDIRVRVLIFYCFAIETVVSGLGPLVAGSDDRMQHRWGRFIGMASCPAENILYILLIPATTAGCFKSPLSARYGADRVAVPNVKIPEDFVLLCVRRRTRRVQRAGLDTAVTQGTTGRETTSRVVAILGETTRWPCHGDTMDDDRHGRL